MNVKYIVQFWYSIDTGIKACRQTLIYIFLTFQMVAEFDEDKRISIEK